MFTAIHEFLTNILDLDFLSSQPKYYFSDGWEYFKEIFSAIEDHFSNLKDTLSSN